MSSTSIFLNVGVNYINIYVIIFHVDVYIINAYVLKSDADENYMYVYVT